MSLNPASQNDATYDALYQCMADSCIEVISFDLFDTLIRRRLAKPEHLFAMLENQVRHRFGVQTGDSWSRQFRHARIHAWYLALHRARLQGRDEVTLREIYQVVAAILPGMRDHQEELQEMEMELEAQFIEPHPPGVTLFNRALKLGKSVVISSDQYMPRTFLDSLLSRFGISGHNHFFLSSELGVLKATGRLYDWIAIRTCLQRDKILHIGDNYLVDVEAARRAGLRAAHVPCVLSRHDTTIAESALLRYPSLSSIAVGLHYGRRADAGAIRDSTLSVGYCLLGPLLVELCRWLAQRLDNGELQQIWFLARDGQVVHRAFQLLYPNLADRTAYVWASRKLLVYGTTALEPEEVLRHYNHLFDDNTSTTLLQILITIFPDFTVAQLEQAAGQTGINLHEPTKDLDLIPLLRQLVERQVSESSDRRSSLIEYFARVAGSNRRIGLFDIGWRANLQRAIESILSGHDYFFTGLYFGQIFEDQLVKSLVHADSFAFNLNFPLEPFHRIVPRQWIVEPLFSGTHPSVTGIHKDVNGDFSPVYERETPALKRQVQAASLLQAEALQFIHDAQEVQLDLIQLGSRNQMLAALQEFLERPTRFDVQAFLESEWMIGIDQQQPESLIHPLPNQAGQAQTAAALEASLWKEGFRAWHGEHTIAQLLHRIGRRQRMKQQLKRLWRAPLGSVKRQGVRTGRQIAALLYRQMYR